MIKVGVFLDENTVIPYRIFEQVLPKFYRLDICNINNNLPFHISNDIVFSIIIKNKTYTKGNSSLYNFYENCKNNAKSISSEIVTSREWVDGNFVTSQTRYIDENNFYSIKYLTGKLDSESYYFGKSQIMLRVLNSVSSETLPTGLSQYTLTDMETFISTGDVSYISYDTLCLLHPLEHLHSKDYKVIQHTDELETLKKSILENNENSIALGYDTETDTLEWNIYSESNLAGFIISCTESHSRYIPILHHKFLSFPIEVFFSFIEWCINNRIKLVAHNKKFEVKIWIYYQYKVYSDSNILLPNIEIEHDSLIASALNNPSIIKGTHTLKYLRSSLEGNYYLDLKDVFPNKIYFPALDIDTTKLYACPDADGTVFVLKDQLTKMKKYNPSMLNLYRLECKLAYLKAEQEFYGMRIDEEATLQSRLVVEENQTILLNWVYKIIGYEIDINKNSVMQDLLYSKLKCPVLARTKTGQPSIAIGTINKLCNERRSIPSIYFTENIINSKNNILLTSEILNSAKYPILHIIRELRNYTKQITGFYNRIQKKSKNSRFFFDINQNGTETGRQSSNIHQISKEIRHILLADSDEHYFVTSDYETMELRLFFSAAGEKSLVEMCKDPYVDLHRAIASKIQNKGMWDISTEERSKDKSRNFGVIYMISGRKLAEQKYGLNPSKEQIEECDSSIKVFFDEFKRCAKFIKTNANTAISKLYTETLFGRIRRFEELANPKLDSRKKASLLRRANNMPIQGTGADVVKLAETLLWEKCIEKGWNILVDTPQGKLPLVRVMISVHDEISLSVHKSIKVEEILSVIMNCMEIQLQKDGEDWAPLFIGTTVCKNWGEAKKEELKIPRGLRLKLIEDYEKTGNSVIPNLSDLYSLINEYRDNEIKDYINSLISKHGTDIDVLWNNLRHPSLTHELINRYPNSDKTLTHHERMKYAIEQYLKGNNFSTSLPINDSPTVILEEEENDEEIEILEDDEVLNIINQTINNTEIIEFFDTIYVDTDKLMEEDVNHVLKLIWEDRDKDGFYSVYLVRYGKIIDTNIKVEELKSKVKILKYIEKRSLICQD